MRNSRPWQGFTLVEALVVIAILAVLFGLTLSAVQRAREAANRTRCLNNLRQMGLALHMYHGTHQSFPPGCSYRDGSDPYYFMGWQARLLPFLEQQALWDLTVQAYAQERIPWENPPHVGFSTPMPVYACPSEGRALSVGTYGDGNKVAFTDYLGVDGIDSFRVDGILYLDSATRLTDITDGTSNTLMVGERPPSLDGFFGWWYGGLGQEGDGSADMVLGVKDRCYNGHFVNCVRRRPYEYGPGRPDRICDTFHFWSLHPGGANFLFADGSARFVPYAARPIMPALATRGGGEAVSLSE